MKPLVLMGNIGCGKTSWGKVLSQKGYNVICEDLTAVTHLNEYWKTGQNAFFTQLEFYISWIELYNKSQSCKQLCLIDSSILSHHLVFTKYMFNKNILSAEEFQICNSLFENILELIDINVVYLYCNSVELINRIKMRNRENELNSYNYIIDLDNMFNEVVEQYNIPVIDISNLDVNNNDDVDYFVKKMKEIK